MSSSKIGVIKYRGFEGRIQPLDNLRVKITRLRAPLGTRVTGEMLDQASQDVKCPRIRKIRLNPDNEVVITSIKMKTRRMDKNGVAQQLDDLARTVFREFTDSLIKQLKEQQWAARRTSAAGRPRTTPVASAVTS